MAHGTRGPQAKGARLFNSLFATHSDILIRVVCTHGLEAPDLWLRVRRTDMIYVLKVKLEIALATVVQKSLRAEDLDLEYKNMTRQGHAHVRDVPHRRRLRAPRRRAPARTSPRRHSCPSSPSAPRNSEPRNARRRNFAPPHRDYAPRRYDHLNELVKTTEGMPSSGMVKRIIARRGVLCQVLARRWFRAEVMRTTRPRSSSSGTTGRIPTGALPAQAAAPPLPPPPPPREPTAAASQAPLFRTPRAPGYKRLGAAARRRVLAGAVAQDVADARPAGGRAQVRHDAGDRVGQGLPAHYAVAESQQMLQEVYARLDWVTPQTPHLTSHVPTYRCTTTCCAHIVKEPRHRVVVLGDMGVGKTTLIKTFCAGKPEEQEFVATPRGSKSGGASATAAAGDDVVRRTTKERAYPTVTARSFQTSVKKPGSEEMLDLEVWDTSGQERFKPLSLAFFATPRA